MTTLAILLVTTAVPSADAVAQPSPASWGSPGDEGPQAGGSPRRFSRLRGLFGRRSQGPQQQPGCACGVRPVPVPVSGTPSAAGPITLTVMSQGPQQQPGAAWGGAPGDAVHPVPVPVSGTPSATEPSPAMSRPEVTTPPVPPEMRRMPVGPPGPS